MGTDKRVNMMIDRDTWKKARAKALEKDMTLRAYIEQLIEKDNSRKK